MTPPSPFPPEVRELVAAAREVVETELGQMACIGSHAPAENALGMLVAAYAKVKGKTEPASVSGEKGKGRVTRELAQKAYRIFWDVPETADHIEAMRIALEAVADQLCSSVSSNSSETKSSGGGK